MEKDRVTRVYFGPSGREAYPVNEALTPVKSKETINAINGRADFIAVSMTSGGKTQKWGVHPQPEGERFEIDSSRVRWPHQYKDLANQVEKRTKKKGLTIVISS